MSERVIHLDFIFMGLHQFSRRLWTNRRTILNLKDKERKNLSIGSRLMLLQPQDAICRSLLEQTWKRLEKHKMNSKCFKTSFASSTLMKVQHSTQKKCRLWGCCDILWFLFIQL
ncbi:CLUMA_CG007568, isoform A [Clunio marinus]|uniref:CLUMA_CG007568, isoform A n=1 Tax=Clunio marinus TaxID=568069 RepID=A0A1J1I371_9DIPT|nr:CLUMA_CG007568, isoform A [Clunio marinus]